MWTSSIVTLFLKKAILNNSWTASLSKAGIMKRDQEHGIYFHVNASDDFQWQVSHP